MAKKRAPRPKRLQLVDHSPIGLTEFERKEFSQLYRDCARQELPPFESKDTEEIRRVHIGRFLGIYVEALCHDAGVENAKSRTRRTVKLRRDALNSMSKLCGRQLAVNDILKELSGYASVPDYAANAIRRDFLRIFV